MGIALPQVREGISEGELIAVSEENPRCSKCGKPISEEQEAVTIRAHYAPMCRNCLHWWLRVTKATKPLHKTIIYG